MDIGWITVGLLLLICIPLSWSAWRQWRIMRERHRTEALKRKEIEDQLQGILEKDPVARSQFNYPFPIGHTPNAEEIVKAHKLRMAAIDDEAWKARLRAIHERNVSTPVVASTRVNVRTQSEPRRDSGDDLLDVAVGIGVGMAIGSMLSDDDSSRSSSSSRSDDDITPGGGSFGGGGSSGSWSDDT